MVLLFFPIPYYDFYLSEIARKDIEVVYFYSEIATALMWLRVYFLFKTAL